MTESAVLFAKGTAPAVTAGPLPARDDVRCLREWGTDELHMLPKAPGDNAVIGTDPNCLLRLRDPHVLPRHARLTHDGSQWRIRAIGAAVVRQDGISRLEVALDGGAEIGIGRTTLIAESTRSMTLRGFCARVLGWQQPLAVDLALRSIRLATTRRIPLFLRGEGDLVPLAHAIHRRTHSDGTPFVVCDPRRKVVAASVRAPKNHVDAMLALKAAAGGSLCVRSRRLPPNFRAVLAELRVCEPAVQLMICVTNDHDGRGLMASSCSVDVPPLASRKDELPRIIEEYALDALAELHASDDCFRPIDGEWVAESAAKTLDEIDKATMRLVSLRSSKGPSTAAQRLRMAPVSFSRWFARREVLTSKRRRPHP